MSKKRMILLVLTLIMTISTTSIFASEVNTTKNNFPITEQNTAKTPITVSMDELANVKLEDTLTHSEMLEYMKNNNYPQETINSFKKIEDKQLMSRSNSTIGYTNLRLDGYRSDHANPYIIIPELHVGLEYRGSGSPQRIVSVGSPTFDTSKGRRCTFDGSFVYELVSGREIYTSLRGDLYKDGRLSWEGGATVKLEELAEIEFKLSGDFGRFIDYISHRETYYSKGLDK